jgi:hypothetical protein
MLPSDLMGQVRSSPREGPPRGGSNCSPAECDVWSWRRDLNPRPSDYKSDALPAELRQRLGVSRRPARRMRAA